MDEIYRTYFELDTGESLGDAEGILPLSLFKGMIITIHGYLEKFEVVDWNFHHGHPDENAGLHIICRKLAKKEMPDSFIVDYKK